ncbi:hypothetical protein, partial [Desulfosporosinus fructosivorans]
KNLFLGRKSFRQTATKLKNREFVSNLWVGLFLYYKCLGFDNYVKPLISVTFLPILKVYQNHMTGKMGMGRLKNWRRAGTLMSACPSLVEQNTFSFGFASAFKQ